MNLPECRYGLSCYRKNADHFKQFKHPAAHAMAVATTDGAIQLSDTEDDEAAGSSSAARPKKRAKTSAAAAAPPAAAATATTAASATTPSAILVFAPGAGGSTAKIMRDDLHADLERRGLSVWRCDDAPLGTGETRWNTMAPGGSSNAQHVVAVAARAAAAHPNVPLVLCGASFGNRVLAELVRTRFDALPPRTAKALLCCGYPLHAVGKPEGADPKRAAHLTNLPPDVHVCIIQGDQDEFLGGRGMASLTDTVARMPCAATTQVRAMFN